jgi:putative NIF3 family GTP cyclohydrolase 1 type 2
MFLGASRRHWSIENECHWILDVAFREDDHRLREGHAPENMSVVRKMALAMLKKATAKIGIKNSVPLVATTADSGHGRIGNLDQAITVRELAQKINEILPATYAPIRVAGNATARVSRVAVVGGSGASFLPDAISAGAECFVTSDLKHHVSLDAVTDQAQSISLIDISHFAAESLWLAPAAAQLAIEVPGVEFLVSEENTDPWSLTIPGKLS